MNLEIYKKYEQQTVKTGTVIFEEQDPGDGMYVIIRGRVNISKRVMAGVDKTLGVLEEGEYFGEMSLLLNENRTASATALEDTTLVKLGRDECKHLLQDSPDVGITMLTQLARRLEKANRESILLALELALAEKKPPEYVSPVLSKSQTILATGSFHLKDIPDILQRAKELRWDPQTNVLLHLFKPGQEEDSLIYVIQTRDIREVMKLTSCFKELVRWKISLAVSPDDALVETFI